MNGFEDFRPAKIEVGDRFRVREVFYAAGIAVPLGSIVRVMAVNERVEERIFELTIILQTLDAPVRSFIWGRTSPLDQKYLEQIMEKL